jgi:hypothetical protein
MTTILVKFDANVTAEQATAIASGLDGAANVRAWSCEHGTFAFVNVRSASEAIEALAESGAAERVGACV